MTDIDTFTVALTFAAFAGGYALGFAHFRMLVVVTTLLIAGNPWGIALQIGRLAILGVGLWALAAMGALALISGLGGILLARAGVVARVRSAR